MDLDIYKMYVLLSVFLFFNVSTICSYNSNLILTIASHVHLLLLPLLLLPPTYTCIYQYRIVFRQ